MATWTLIPVGGIMIMVTEVTVPPEEMDKIVDTSEKLTKITGMRWVFLPQTRLINAETVREIADRLAGVER
jgi:hypothetical protein